MEKLASYIGWWVLFMIGITIIFIIVNLTIRGEARMTDDFSIKIITSKAR